MYLSAEEKQALVSRYHAGESVAEGAGKVQGHYRTAGRSFTREIHECADKGVLSGEAGAAEGRLAQTK